MLTGKLPYGKIFGSEVIFRVLGGEQPSKPVNALELGLSAEVWKLLQSCWQSQRTLRPPIRDVSDRVKIAASVCGTLPSVGSVPQRHVDPDSNFTKFGGLFPHSSSNVEFTEFCRPIVPWNALRRVSIFSRIHRVFIPHGVDDEASSIYREHTLNPTVRASP